MAELAPDCRFCGATNDSRDAECWMCHRRGWQEPPEPRPDRRPRSYRPREGCGCVVFVAMILIALVMGAFELATLPFQIGRAVAILGMLILAAMIALFATCTIAL